MQNLSSGQIRVLAIIAILMICMAGLFFFKQGRMAEREIPILPTKAAGLTISPPISTVNSTQTIRQSSPTHNSPPTTTEIVVHVAGAVRKPGIYQLEQNSRANDALKAAGGWRTDANIDAVNLAQKVEDGQQLYFPTRKEQPSGGATVSITPSKALASSSNRTSLHSSSSKSAKFSHAGKEFIHLNNAGLDELQRLPGVGPAMAQRILDYRKQVGSFTNPEQLMEVSGIGEKKYAKIKPFLNVH